MIIATRIRTPSYAHCSKFGDPRQPGIPAGLFIDDIDLYQMWAANCEINHKPRLLSWSAT